MSSSFLRTLAACGQSSAICPTGIMAIASKSRREKVARHLFRVVITHPTGSQSTFCGGKTKMFGGNGCINVAVRLVVVRTNPVFRRVLHTYNIYRSRFEPFSVVTFLQLGLVFFRSNHYEFPRLSVTCRRSKACGVENILKIVLAYGLVGKFTGRKTFFAQFQKKSDMVLLFLRGYFSLVISSARFKALLMWSQMFSLPRRS